MIKIMFDFLKNWKYETAIFVFLMISGLSIVQSFFSVGYWPFSFHLLDYSLGFGSRLLVGSIFNFIFQGFLDFKLISLTIFLFISFNCFLISILLGKVLKLSDKIGNNTGIIFLVLLYLAVPTRFSVYFSSDFIAYLEIYIFAVVLLMIYIFLNCKQNFFFWILISLLSIICMAIHQGFFFIMFPIILSLMIYNLYEKKWQKNTLLATLFVCIITVISFLFFQFFSKINVPDIETLTLFALNKTNIFQSSDIELITNAYMCEYFYSLYVKTVRLMLFNIRNIYNPILLLLTIVLFSPLLIVLGKIWQNIYNNCVERYEKITFILIQCCSLINVFLFIVACDWGRWFIWLVTFQFAILFILYWKQSKPVVSALNSLGDFVENNKFIMILLLLYFMIFKMNLSNIIGGFECLL